MLSLILIYDGSFDMSNFYVRSTSLSTKAAMSVTPKQASDFIFRFEISRQNAPPILAPALLKHWPRNYPVERQKPHLTA